MGLDLAREESVSAIAEAVLNYCNTISDQTSIAGIWKGFGELGLFSLPELFGECACAASCAAMEVLGRKGLGGPFADTLAFTACAPAEMLEPVASGDVIACLGQLPLIPLPESSSIHITEINGEAVLLDITSVVPVDMMDGDRWVRAQASPGKVLGAFAPWADRYDIAISGWLVGAGLELIEAASAHASQRVQFGKTIGEFQAVSAPLARAVMSLDSAKVLAEAAAVRLDAGDGSLVTAARWSAARAAEQAAITAHQTYGAFGVLEDGPVFGRSRRIRQLATQFPQERPVDAEAALGNRSLGLVERN